MKAYHNIMNGLRLKNTINISEIVTVYYYDFTADYVSGYEYHDFWEFVYVDNGRVIATSDDKVTEINKNEIIFHKPNEVHSVKCDGVTPANIFIMSFVTKSPAMKFFGNKILTVPYHLQGLLASIVEEVQSSYGENPGHISFTPNNFGTTQIIKNYLELFLLLFYRSVESTENSLTYPKLFYHEKTAQSKLATDIIGILENSIYKVVTLEDICAETNYGKSYVCELFKEVTGKTVIEYLTELKIREAKMLMREKRMNNTQISDALCFSSPQYFTRVFKKHTSMTPGEYKKSLKFR